MAESSEDRIERLEEQVNRLSFLVNQLGLLLRDALRPPAAGAESADSASSVQLESMLYTWGQMERGVTQVDPPCWPLCFQANGDYTAKLEEFKAYWPVGWQKNG